MDNVRVCLTGLGFGLLVAGILNLPLRIAGIVEMDPAPSPGTRSGMLIIGIVTVLLTSIPPVRPRRGGLRYLCGLLFTSMLVTLGAVVGGTLAFPVIARQVDWDDHSGHWTGRLEYRDKLGPRQVELHIVPDDPGPTRSGSLTTQYGNGQRCVFSLKDSRAYPGRGLSIHMREESTDKLSCQSWEGAELDIRQGPSDRELELFVRTDPAAPPVATGMVIPAGTNSGARN
jgi:hypothetical protein